MISISTYGKLATRLIYVRLSSLREKRQVGKRLRESHVATRSNVQSQLPTLGATHFQTIALRAAS